MRTALPPLLLLVVGLSPVHGAVPWNPRAPENGQLLPAFNYATVETVLDAIRATHRRAGTSAARPLIAVTFPNGRRAVISLLSCTADGATCRALGIQSSWNPPAGVARSRLTDAVERFNQRYSFSKAYLTAQGRPALQRYLTADYGFIRGDLAVNLLVFSNQADRFANEVVRPLAGGTP
jgi:Putative bacterial sensory transduction regulator